MIRLFITEIIEMRERQFALFFLLILSAIVIFAQNELRACSCVPPPPPSEAFENSETVFMAMVTSFKRAGEYRRVAKLTLLTLWKGEKALTGEIFTGLNCADCGFDFVVGKTYVIYAYRGDDGALRTNICTRTASLDEAGEDLTFLDQKDPFFIPEDSGCCGDVSGGDALLAGGVLLFLVLRRNYTHAA